MAVQATLASIAFQNIQVRDSAGLKKRAGTGCAAIDEALRGGFDFGQISCLSGGNNGACGTVRSFLDQRKTSAHITRFCYKQSRSIYWLQEMPMWL